MAADKPHILIVDDDPGDRQAVADALRREGVAIGGVEAEVLEADSLTAARAALEREEFACIFLDHTLPDGVALSLLLEVRAQGLATPVVVLTGRRDAQVITEIMEAGAADYLPKERLHPELVARSLQAALRFQQGQREKRAVLDELRARDRAIAAASNGIVIADPRQPDCPLIYTNAAFLNMTGYSEDEVIGRNCRFLQGPNTDPSAVQALRDAVQNARACQTLILNYRKDGTAFWNEITVSPVLDASGSLTHFVGIQTDVTDRHETDDTRRMAHEALRVSEEALRRNEMRLQDAQARLEAALDAGGIATWTFDLATDTVVADAGLARLFSVSAEEAAGGRLDAYLQAVHPDDLPRVTQAIADAIAYKEVYQEDYRVVLPDGSSRWLATRGKVERDAQGEAVALPGVVVDITERVEREKRERFLADLAERARGLTDPDAVIADTVSSVGAFLGVSRCLFADIDIEADTCAIKPDYCADPSVRSIEGVVSIAAFGQFVVTEYAARRAVIVDDVQTDPIKAPPESVAAYEAIGIRAHVTVPVVHTGRVVSCISVHNAAPRHWKPEEIDLLRAVVERTWLTVEVLRQQRTLAQEADTLRAAHERTTRILASISDAFFALDAEWRFTYINDQSERIMARRREDLLGHVFWDEFPAATGSQFERAYRRAVSEQTSVTFEEFYPPLDIWVEVRAYPSEGGLSVFFQDISTRRALEEARAQIAEREHRIAEQLQAALTPSVPERIPGMALAKHYEAALAEAGVGGDFYDVFPVDKGCTALVVGDLSGKGLAAASQVATVRNMLRYALHRARTPSEAVEGLNSLLAEQGLLTGFATLFVGAFDSGAGTLTYVNCGQEPALVRRAASGVIEPLPPTGPVLGSFEGAAFEERRILLAPGDALAAFTDGLTEVGQSRKEMLGIEGVADLFADAVIPAEVQDAEAIAEHLAAGLIAGVDAAAQGGVMRDDVCLLVAVVNGPPQSSPPLAAAR